MWSVVLLGGPGQEIVVALVPWKWTKDRNYAGVIVFAFRLTCLVIGKFELFTSIIVLRWGTNGPRQTSPGHRSFSSWSGHNGPRNLSVNIIILGYSVSLLNNENNLEILNSIRYIYIYLRVSLHGVAQILSHFSRRAWRRRLHPLPWLFTILTSYNSCNRSAQATQWSFLISCLSTKGRKWI